MWTNFSCSVFWILEKAIRLCSVHKTSEQHCVLAMCDVLSQNAAVVPQMHMVHCTVPEYWCAHAILHQNACDTTYQNSTRVHCTESAFVLKIHQM